MSAKYILNFEYQDTGFCRAIYTYRSEHSGKSYYCVQEEFKGVYVIYSCSQDEEPIAEMKPKEGVKFEPSGDKGTDDFLKSQNLLLEV